jgi:hypothetical protein
MNRRAIIALGFGWILLGDVAAQEKWGVTTVDSDGITLLAGALNLEGQPAWRYYNAGDAPEGAFMGWLPVGRATLQGTVKLPNLSPPAALPFFQRGRLQREEDDPGCPRRRGFELDRSGTPSEGGFISPKGSAKFSKKSAIPNPGGHARNAMERRSPLL